MHNIESQKLHDSFLQYHRDLNTSLLFLLAMYFLALVVSAVFP